MLCADYFRDDLARDDVGDWRADLKIDEGVKRARRGEFFVLPAHMPAMVAANSCASLHLKGRYYCFVGSHHQHVNCRRARRCERGEHALLVQAEQYVVLARWANKGLLEGRSGFAWDGRIVAEKRVRLASEATALSASSSCGRSREVGPTRIDASVCTLVGSPVSIAALTARIAASMSSSSVTLGSRLAASTAAIRSRSLCRKA